MLLLLASLLWPINSALAQASLSLNSVSSFSSATTSVLALPPSPRLVVTVALCSPSTSARFLVSNSSSDVTPTVADDSDTFQINIAHGLGSWTGAFPNGGALGIATDQGAIVRFQVGVSDQDALHQVSQDLPIFGDSTSSQAILFSHPILPPPPEPNQSFPNYTLAPALPSIPVPENTPANVTLILAESSTVVDLPQTACMLSTLGIPVNSNVNQSTWLRDPAGWRSQFVVDGLSPATNYSAYVIQDNSKISGPVFFATKSTSFSCPLIHSLPYCPAVAYAVPLPPPPDGSSAYSTDNLPASISDPILSYLTNFTVSLSTFACGRDWYSPLVGCSDCQREYRKWLCAVSFPRCGDPNSGTAPAALLPQDESMPPRNPFFPLFDQSYHILLPCIETCTAVDRACPDFIKFRCPSTRFNANATYDVGPLDDASQVSRVPQDRYGNVWCNGS